MLAAWLALLDSMIGIALALAGIVAAHYRLAAPFQGFVMFAGGLFFAVIALFFSIVALVMMLFSPGKRVALGRAVAGGALGFVVVVPVLMIAMTHQYPAINDITTDTANPPEFVHAQQLPANQNRSLKYDPATARVQQSTPAYGDLAPLKLNAPPDAAYKQAEIIAGEVTDWRITNRDPQNHTIEGVATSALFRFNDDFVIQIRPAPGGGSLVEMRSKSRDGKGDLGANYHRIKSFFRLLQGPPRGAAQATS